MWRGVSLSDRLTSESVINLNGASRFRHTLDRFLGIFFYNNKFDTVQAILTYVLNE